VQSILEKIRVTIRKAAPAAEEKISYQIPAFLLHGNLIFFAAYQHHIGLYPAPPGVEKFKKELGVTRGAKGRFSFPSINPFRSA
jgi:uncharacterized protein YdhG (YjbR/CyaY superfamily)